VDPTAEVINGSVVGAGAVVGPGAKLDGTILFDGAEVGAEAQLKSSFVAPDFKVPENLIGEGNFFGF
jgi:mannose-1-phosphate guanylyltransferase